MFGILQVDETLAPFKLTQEQLMLVKSRMRAGLEAGLKNEGSSAVKMLPSYVYRTPDGTGQRSPMKPWNRRNGIFQSWSNINQGNVIFCVFPRTWKIPGPGSGRDKL